MERLTAKMVTKTYKEDIIQKISWEVAQKRTTNKWFEFYNFVYRLTDEEAKRILENDPINFYKSHSANYFKNN